MRYANDNKESVYDYVSYGNEDLFADAYVAANITERAEYTKDFPGIVAEEVMLDHPDMFRDLFEEAMIGRKESLPVLRDAILADLGTAEIFACVRNEYRSDLSTLLKAKDCDSAFSVVSELITKAAYNAAEKELQAEADEMLQELEN